MSLRGLRALCESPQLRQPRARKLAMVAVPSGRRPVMDTTWPQPVDGSAKVG